MATARRPHVAGLRHLRRHRCRRDARQRRTPRLQLQHPSCTSAQPQRAHCVPATAGMPPGAPCPRCTSGEGKAGRRSAGWEGASTQRDREAGFVDALAAAGMRLHAREVGNFVMEEAKSAALRMFSNDPPDAVFVANDHMAIAVMDTLRHDLQLRIPDDLSVVSYDDVSAASWAAYDLTTVRQPANQMVRETIDLLLGKIDDPDSPQCRIEIEGQLIVRGSARVPEGWR